MKMRCEKHIFNATTRLRPEKHPVKSDGLVDNGRLAVMKDVPFLSTSSDRGQEDKHE